MNGLRLAIAMFTIAPVPRAWHDGAIERARVTLRWLPLIGGLLGGLAGLIASAVLARSDGASLLGATLSIAALALLSRGLHLDGLADTADGLGSRAPAERALEIMKQSDIGPFGVIAIGAVLLIDVTALATTIGVNTWTAPAALAVAAATGRLAVVHAALPGTRAARPGGFGALVAGTIRPVEAVLLTAGVLGTGAALAAAVDASVLGWIAAQAGALVFATALRWHCVRRFGGITGDVFGALIEVATAATLVGLALA